jgi:hypothetical protein
MVAQKDQPAPGQFRASGRRFIQRDTLAQRRRIQA